MTPQRNTKSALINGMAEREGLPLAMPVCATRFFQISLKAKDAFKPMALWAGME
jgi:hypothetical protein